MIPICMRWPPAVLLTTALLLGAAPGAAVAAAWDPARAAALSDWHWDAPQVFDLAGARVLIWSFQAPLAPADAARVLQHAGASRFDRLQFSGAVLSLAGMQAGRHWLAQLQPAEGNAGSTRGRLSSLEPASATQRGFDPQTLVPPGARPVLRAASRMAAGTSVMASYLCPGSYLRVATSLRRALWAQHWRPSGRTAGPASGGIAAAGEWRRPDGARLTVDLQARADGVALTLWHRSKESS